ncbi:MAG: IS110 family transposase [Micromonosporaceae bacterium]
MQYAPTLSLPAMPPGGVTAGLDWASADHAVCVIDAATGAVISRFTIEHTTAGLAELVRRLAKASATEIAIERGDGPVVDALLTAGVTVVVISPNQLKNLRSRYGQAGNKDDRFDAYVLADTLRTDRARLRPLQPDSPATVSLRATVRARRDLVAHRVAVCNQLRAHLQRVFPGVVGLFRDLDSPISLAFLARFDCQDRADWLSPKRLAAWLASAGYSGRKDPTILFGHLTSAPRGATSDQGGALAHTTRALLAVLRSLAEQIKALSEQIAEQLALHADGHIFTSLPRSGTVRAARLLAEIGDCRARFPDPESLICLAGVAPSTRQSGKHKAVTFRWAVNKQLRDAVCDFAADSRRAHPWAAQLYNHHIARGKDHPHATRILARAWLYVIWHCWHDHNAYDPTQHGALQRLLKQDQQAAA